MGSGPRKNSRRQARLRRSLRNELLEARKLLAADLWQAVDAESVDLQAHPSYVRALDFELFNLDVSSIQDELAQAPLEFETNGSELPSITIPNPDGELETFYFMNSPIMAPELAAKFPSIQTYLGFSSEDAATKVRFDYTPTGFHAQVLSPSGSYFVDPFFHLAAEPLYASYYLDGEFDVSDLGEVRLHDDSHENESEHQGRDDGSSDDSGSAEGEDDSANSGTAGRTGDQLRIYRAAVAATGEYVAFHGGTVETGMAAIVTAMNRVVGVYEQELTIRMELVANNDQVVYTDAGSDPFSNNNAGAMLGENQTTLDAVIGNANYDIGHVFSTGGGGLAALGSVGINPIKAQGVTGLPAPTGDPFYIDFVSHEIGHQFGGRHTFNGDSGACSTNRSGGAAFEPGSGSTIQAYAGICGDDNLQQNSDPNFHAASLDEIIAHADTVIPGVGARRATGNTAPFVSAGNGFTIPAGTPFALTAQGGDFDGDVVTYSWEQMDLGPQQDVNAGDNGSSPLFRSWIPSTNPTRYFPRLQDLANNTTVIGETLPTTNRNLNFRATIRDNRVGAGGVNTDDIQLTVVDTGAPFVVTSQGAAANLNGLDVETVTWDVAGTDQAPISSTNVSIYMSIDGGLSFPIAVAEDVPNDGSHDIVVPNVDTTEARFMVRGADSFFFDISDVNIAITAAPISFDLGAPSPDYVENQAPVPVAANAAVNNASALSYQGLSIEARLDGTADAEDRIQAVGQGNGTDEIDFNAGSITFNGATIGTISSSDQNVVAVLNSQATDAGVNALLRSISFSHDGDNPGSQVRTIEFVFGQASVQSTTIGVVPTNDSPTVADSTLPSILEDTTDFQAARVSDIFGTTFSDVDDGSSMSGIAIVGNLLDATQGDWFFSTNNTVNWVAVGQVELDAQSIVLAPDSFLAFIPAADFFGIPTPLSVVALDNTYSGGFSNSASNTRVPLDPSNRTANGSASMQPAQVSIEVINVNDPPVANSPGISLTVQQGDQLNEVLSENLFIDIDSPDLIWEITSATGVPQWLNFNPNTRALTGTPENRDVGNYFLTLSVRDETGATASVPLQIEVLNVNDAPIDLRLSNDVISEGEGNRIVGGLIAIDPDTGDEVTWSVSDGRFSVIDSNLWVTSSIDYETDQLIPLVLTATDNGTPPLASSLGVTIRVTDINEFTPTLDLSDIELPDGTPSGTLIDDIDSSDGDFGSNVTFELLGPDKESFAIDTQSGELTLLETLDFQTQSQYRIFIEASDDGQPIRSRTGQIIVNVDPVNVSPPTAESPQTFSVPENSPAGTVVGTLVGQDSDNHGLLYALTGSDAFEVDAATGEIRVAAGAELDFESQEFYNLVGEVTEDVTPNRSVLTNVVISLEDLEDNPYSLQVANSDVPIGRQGLEIGTIAVDDGIGSPAERFILSTDDPRFEVNDGVLRLAPGFNLTSLNLGTLEVLVNVADTTGVRAVETAAVTLNVIEASAWTNLAFPEDVDRDGFVSGIDALLVIDRLNQGGNTTLSNPRTEAELAEPDFDVSQDGFLTGIDALLVIFLINQGSDAEGESAYTPHHDLWNTAFEQLEEERRDRLELL